MYSMSERGKKFSRVKNRGGSFFSEGEFMSREKSRARELRNSSWWKKKISSGKCYYCGDTFRPADLTMDHKIPLARGGTSDRINLVPCCKECNNKKKHMLPSEWDEYMDKLVKMKVID